MIHVGSIFIGGVAAYTMFDSGATHCFVSPALARNWDSRISFAEKRRKVETAGPQLIGSSRTYLDVPVVIEGVELLRNFLKIELKRYETWHRVIIRLLLRRRMSVKQHLGHVMGIMNLWLCLSD